MYTLLTIKLLSFAIYYNFVSYFVKICVLNLGNTFWRPPCISWTNQSFFGPPLNKIRRTIPVMTNECPESKLKCCQLVFFVMGGNQKWWMPCGFYSICIEANWPISSSTQASFWTFKALESIPTGTSFFVWSNISIFVHFRARKIESD